MELTLRDVKQAPAELAAVRRIYERAFPQEERMPFWMLRWRSRQKNVRLYGAYHGGALVAMAHLISDGSTAYLLYFAVEEHCRGQGVGSQVLSLLKARLQGQTILLCIEPEEPGAPNAAQRQRRRRFYARGGFRETGYQAREGAVVFDLLAYGPPADKAAYLRLMRSFIGWPLRLVFHPQVFDKPAPDHRNREETV